MGTLNKLRVDVLVRLISVCELLLVAWTWTLWFAASGVPRIPLFGLFVNVHDTMVIGASGLFTVLTLACVIRPPSPDTWATRGSGIAALAAGALTVCLNQLCLQPWHWMFLLVILFRTVVPARDVMNVWRVLAATVYLYAALSRIGPKVDAGMSRQVVLALLNISGLSAAVNNADMVSWICIAFTIGEFLTGCLLLVPKTRRFGMMAGVVMHATLLLALGPFGLNQAVAVLIWNVFLIVWLVILFRNADANVGDRVATREHRRTDRVATLAAGFCFVWPSLALAGLTDAWTGWQVYSPRPAVVGLQVRLASRAQVPVDSRYFTDPRPLDDWHTVRMDRWCLDETGVPLYPSARFQLGLAKWLTRGVPQESKRDIRATLDAPGIPFWWKRTQQDLSDVSEIRKAAATFILNSRAAGRTVQP